MWPPGAAGTSLILLALPAYSFAVLLTATEQRNVCTSGRETHLFTKLSLSGESRDVVKYNDAKQLVHAAFALFTDTSSHSQACHLNNLSFFSISHRWQNKLTMQLFIVYKGSAFCVADYVHR